MSHGASPGTCGKQIKSCLEFNREKMQRFSTHCSLLFYNRICCNRLPSVTEE